MLGREWYGYVLDFAQKVSHLELLGMIFQQ
jgi:hypothetical protein